jgi:hypothetical protein
MKAAGLARLAPTELFTAISSYLSMMMVFAL